MGQQDGDWREKDDAMGDGRHVMVRRGFWGQMVGKLGEL